MKILEKFKIVDVANVLKSLGNKIINKIKLIIYNIQ